MVHRRQRAAGQEADVLIVVPEAQGAAAERSRGAGVLQVDVQGVRELRPGE